MSFTPTTLSNSSLVELMLLVFRLFLGLTIFAHGFQKFFRGGKIAGTAGWFESIGMKPGRLNAYAAATTETGAGALLVAGLFTPLASAGLVALMVVAIVTVHRGNGFFNFNKGQGVEYNLALIVMALLLGTLGAGRYSLDHLWHPYDWTPGKGLLVTAVLGAGGGLAQLAVFYRPTSKA
ncbi:MAG TPA: DoxX family protein [Acidimicrobiales bacterium]|nr:DoxX family protein [Acidimicrobiales bacterium]HUX03665.1 DoxX family protein [Acidimicrobiales bacterium]